MNPSPQPSPKRHSVQARRLNIYKTMQKPIQTSQTLPSQSQSQTQAAFHTPDLNNIVFFSSVVQVVQAVLVFQCSAENLWASVFQVFQHCAKNRWASFFQVFQHFAKNIWIPIFCVKYWKTWKT